MAKPVIHEQVYRPGPFGGVMNTTLCGRLASGEDMNVADGAEKVTCKLCLRRIESRKEQVAIQNLHDAVEFVERTSSLPRCRHKNCLRDHGGELLEPECGCRLTYEAST